jgi:ABC-type multidrug transport system fused ATPase/permease subunit
VQRVVPPSSSLANYRLVAWWVLNDAIGRFKRRIAVLAVLGGLGIFMQGGALGAALLYARTVEQGDPVNLLGYQFDPRADLELLVFVASALTIALLLGGYLLYRFKSGAISLGREYESLRIQETLAGASRLPHPAVPRAHSLLDEAHVAQVQRDARICGRVLRTIVGGFIPVVVVPVTGIGLLLLNPLLTILLAALTAAVAAIMFRINRRGARASERMERTAKDATRERKDAVRGLLAGDLRLAASRNTPQVADTGTVNRHLEAYTDRLQSIEDSGLASSLLTAFALGAILLLEGRAVLAGDSSISTLLTYLVLLRLFLTHFMRLSRSVAAVSRFYPQIKRHFTFADEAKPAMTDPPRPAKFPCTLDLPPLHPAGQQDRPPRVEAGDRIAFLTEGNLSRKNLAGLAEVLQPPPGSELQAAHVRMVEPAQPGSGRPRLETVPFAPDTELGEVRSDIEQLLSADAVRRLLDHPRTEADTDGQDGELSSVDAWIVSFLAALSWRPHALVTHTEHWCEAPSRVREALRERAQQSALVHVAHSLSPPPEKFGLAVFATTDELVGWAPPSRMDAASQTFHHLTASSRGSRRPTVVGFQEDEDEEEE